MASQTLKWRVDRTKAMLRKFAPTLVISDQMVRLMVHFSRNDVYKKYMPQREHLCRKTATFTDGDDLPVDYVRYAENAVHDAGAGKKYPLEYIPVEKLPYIKGQPLFKAYPESPKICIFDQKINLYPAGITADVDYYYRPADLWKSDNSIDETQTDNMPQETEYAIVRGAFERCVALAEGRQAAMELIAKNKMESEQAAMDWYTETLKANINDTQPLV